MERIPAEAIREVEWALHRYEEEVRAAGLARSTEDTYVLHAQNFVRWLKGEFKPGATLPKSNAPG